MRVRKSLIAFTAPMMLFLVLLALRDGLKNIGGPFWVSSAEYWIYPAQTMLCGGLVFWFWPEYGLRTPHRAGVGVVIGLIAFVLWISPQALFHSSPRLSGFDPSNFADQMWLYAITVLFRF